MKNILVILFLFLSFGIFAQKKDTISLSYCYTKARENYPSLKQKGLFEKNNDLKIKNLNKNYLPQMGINLQATYQSDVTEIVTEVPLPINYFPTMSKDMYKGTLDINQSIYDGSSTSFQKQVENLSLKTDMQSVEVELNKLKERINQIYFNIVLTQENIKLLNNIKAEIQSKLAKMDASYKGEVATKSNVNILKAELYNNDQKITELEYGKIGNIKMLEEYLMEKIDDSCDFMIPNYNVTFSDNVNLRPEMVLYDNQMFKLDATKKLSNSKLYPRVSAFGQLGVGKPGLNMLLNEFKGFYYVGLKVNWNFWNWNLSSNEKKIIDIQKNIIATQKETFDMNVKISLQKDITDIEKYGQLIKKDKEIIALRQDIVASSSAQLENGIITATEYITELNNKRQAEINLKLHELQLEAAKISYLYNIGKI